MARRLPNRPPRHEPSVVVDPRLYLESVDALDAPASTRDQPSEPPEVERVSLLRAITLILLSACASYSGVRLLRAQLPSTAHAALVVTPLAPPSAVPEPLAPLPVVLSLPPPHAPVAASAPEPAWMQRIQEGRAQLAAGKLDEAEAVFRAVLIQRAEVPAAQLGLARVRLARGDCSEASTLAAAVLARMPQHRGARDVLDACLRVESSSASPDVPTRVATARDRPLPPNPF